MSPFSILAPAHWKQPDMPYNPTDTVDQVLTGLEARMTALDAVPGVIAGLNLMIDTDWAQDPDDCMGLAIAINAHKRKHIKLIGVNCSVSNNVGAPGVKAFLKGYSLDSVPVSAYKGSVGTLNIDRYAAALAIRFGNGATDTRANYPDDVASMRTWLAACADNSVAIVTIGGLTSMAALLASPADGISPLTGVQLIAAKGEKTGRCTTMAGQFTNTTIQEFNARMDPDATAFFQANWPSTVPLTWMDQPVGATVFCGPRVEADPFTDPSAYVLNHLSKLIGGDGATRNKRQSWDPLAVERAIYGSGNRYLLQGANGTITVGASPGTTVFSAATPGPHSYVRKEVSDGVLGARLDQFIEQAEVGAGDAANTGNFLFGMDAGGTAQIESCRINPLVKLVRGADQREIAGEATYTTGPVGLVFPSAGTRTGCTIEPRAAIDTRAFYVGAICNYTSTTALQMIACRSGGGDSRRFQLAQIGGKLRLLVFHNAVNGFTTYDEPGTSVVAGQTAVFSAAVRAGTWTMFKNGTQIATGALAQEPFSSRIENIAPIFIGTRLDGTTYGDPFVGTMYGFAYKADITASDAAAKNAELTAIAAAKGITLV